MPVQGLDKQFIEVLEEVKKPKFLPLNLQFFADEDDDGGTGDGQDDDNTTDDNDDVGGGTNKQDEGGTGDDDNSQDTKTTKQNTKKNNNSFSQEDVNNIAAREAKKAQEKLLRQLGVKDVDSAKEGLKQFKKLQDQNKTEQEKLAERAETLQNENQELSTKAENLEAKVAAMSNDVKPDSVDDVVVLAKNLVDDDTDMDKAIKQVLKKYPHFKRGADTDDDSKKKKKPKFTESDHKNNSKETEQEKWQKAFKFPSF